MNCTMIVYEKYEQCAKETTFREILAFIISIYCYFLTLSLTK